MMAPWVVAMWCLLAYLVGGIPAGWLVVRRQRYGLDLRRFGTGNIGTSNVYRHAGFDLAVVVGPLQFAQGLAPVLGARLTGVPPAALTLVAVCAVAGNGWPAYLHFNGGRGVAVATGAVATLTVAGFIALLACFAGGALRGRIALAALVAFLILPAVALVFGDGDRFAVAGGCVAILGLIILRRLEGLSRDAHDYGHFWRRAYRRLVFDERPGRPLMGPRTDPGAESLHS